MPHSGHKKNKKHFAQAIPLPKLDFRQTNKDSPLKSHPEADEVAD